MKITAAYCLLFFYAAALFKPVLPHVSDFIAHTFAHEHHISTVHHHHGAAHVHHEVAKAAGRAQDEEKRPEVKFSEPVSAHLLSAYEYDFVLRIKSNTAYTDFSGRLLFLSLQVLLPPPKRL